jgi:hypothetical protein
MQGSIGAPSVDYAKQHAVLALLTSLIETLLLERPSDPLSHLIEVLTNGQVNTSTAQRYFSVAGTSSSSDAPAPPAAAAAAAAASAAAQASTMTVDTVQNVAAPVVVDNDVPVADVVEDDTSRGGGGGGGLDKEVVAFSDADSPQNVEVSGSRAHDGSTSVAVPENT